jgi:hypothetical protein
MPSSQTDLSADSTQPCHATARLSSAILELDKLIIRVSQLGTQIDQPPSDDRTFLCLPKPAVPVPSPALEHAAELWLPSYSGSKVGPTKVGPTS